MYFKVENRYRICTETLLNSNSDGDATEESEAMDTSEGGAVGGKKKQKKY